MRVAVSLMIAACLLALAACQTTRPVSPFTSLRTDAAEECAKHCDALGMQLGALVVIYDATGCVCEPRRAEPQVSQGGAAISGGAVVYAVNRARQQQQQQNAQQAGQR